ncbi:MAG: phage/plasmid primase, P4 family [Oscillospiraceae bacterium]|nr:phage/plasmid primase, P4 family [Oscillospiraceae bacterium]
MIEKKQMTEEDIKLRYITPAITLKWSVDHITMETKITDGKMNLKGNFVFREKPKKADYILYINKNNPIAIVEAKDNNHTVSYGLQQAMTYAQMLDVPFAYSSNGDAFYEHDFLTGQERQLTLSEFPTPDELFARYQAGKGLNDKEKKIIEQPYYSSLTTYAPRYYQRNAVNRTVDAIDAIFRDSALYRDKWERDDYRESTINIGIEACHGVFHRSRMDHPYFIKFDEKGAPYVFPPLLAKWTREQLHYILVRDNGRQALLMYVYEGGYYRLYAQDMLKGVMKGYIAGYDEELVSMGKVAEAYNQVTTDLNYVSQDNLNSNEDLINFNNGLLRITDSNATLVPHSPDILSTIQIPCSWTGRETPTPVFDRYMHTLTNGDKAIEQLLLEFIGVCISNVKGWRMKKALFLVGDGDTGKSQLKSLVERLLGKGNFIGIDLREIESRFGTGAIYNTRLAGSSDMSFLAVVEMKIFKKTIGGDSLFAEFKGQQAFEFTYNGLLWFCMNRLPKFGGDDGKWVYDRIMVVRCPNVIPKDKQDKKLLDKMYAERDGIVFKAVKALQTVIANGYRFSEPDSVSLAREKYMAENNTVISFFEECMCEWPDMTMLSACTSL